MLKTLESRFGQQGTGAMRHPSRSRLHSLDTRCSSRLQRHRTAGFGWRMRKAVLHAHLPGASPSSSPMDTRTEGAVWMTITCRGCNKNKLVKPNLRCQPGELDGAGNAGEPVVPLQRFTPLPRHTRYEAHCKASDLEFENSHLGLVLQRIQHLAPLGVLNDGAHRADRGALRRGGGQSGSDRDAMTAATPPASRPNRLHLQAAQQPGALPPPHVPRPASQACGKQSSQARAPGRTLCTSSNQVPPAPPPPGAPCGCGTASPARSFAAQQGRRGGGARQPLHRGSGSVQEGTVPRSAAWRSQHVRTCYAVAGLPCAGACSDAHLHLAAHRHAAPALDAPAARGARAACETDRLVHTTAALPARDSFAAHPCLRYPAAPFPAGPIPCRPHHIAAQPPSPLTFQGPG